MRPTLLVPVENQIRELDAKLLLACVAAECAFPPALGPERLGYCALFEFAPGVFIAKSMRACSKLMSAIIRGLGHALLARDEESLLRHVPLSTRALGHR